MTVRTREQEQEVEQESENEVEDAVWEALEQVTDPHIPVSLADMGMIYGVEVGEDDDVVVTMTYPCMGCPAYGMIQEDVIEAAESVDVVGEAAVEVTWDPVWSKDMMTEEARQQMTAAGISY